MTNLQAAHKRCNSIKGTRTIDQIDAAPAILKPARSPATQFPGSVFPEIAGPTPKRPRYGVKEPRIASLDAKAFQTSHGRAFALSKQVGFTLMPWQRYVLKRLYHLDGKRFAHHRALISVGRQNGKTFAAALLLADRLMSEETADGRWCGAVLAHKLQFSKRIFTAAVAIIEQTCPERIDNIWRGSVPGITLDGGTRELYPQAANESAGHSLSLDCVVMDELWHPKFTPAVVEDGLAPTQVARPNPQLIALSTAGTEDSEVMLKWRAKAIDAIDAEKPQRFLLCEWSPKASTSVDDPVATAQANPALGHTLRWDDLDERLEEIPRAAYMRSHLNLFTAAETPWLDDGLWARALRPDVEFTPTVATIERGPDGDSWSGVWAGRTDKGDAVVVDAAVYASEEDAWKATEGWLADGISVHIGVSLEDRWPWRDDNEPAKLVGIRELKQWAPHVRTLARSGAICHTGHRLLGEHVARAQADVIRAEGTQFPSTSASTGPIWLCRQMVWCVALVTMPDLAAPKPVLHIARSAS